MARLEVRTERLALRAPLRTAWGELGERELLRVRLAFPDGSAGEGEAAPLEPYDGVPLASVAAALQVYAEILATAPPPPGPDGAAPGEDPPAREDASAAGAPSSSGSSPSAAGGGSSAVAAWHAALLAACAAERDVPQALAAVDLALWDLVARREGVPVARLLAAAPADAVAVNATIGAEDRAGAAEAARAAVAAGFGCLKVKVGIGDDAGRLAAVRAAVGGGVLLRADANGAWSSSHEALANLRALAPIGLELCEEPVHGLEALRAVRTASPVPVAMDESAAEPGAAASGAADAVCLKIARCGGITGLLREAAAARAAGMRIYVASTFDGPLGIAAGLHAAAALAAPAVTSPDAPGLPHCGLATLGAFAGLEGVLEPSGGRIAVPAGPGLL